MLDCLAIQAYLPHRYPFLFVDRIVELEPYKRAVGLKNVTLNEPFFKGHFPERPIMPAVLILEGMAQVAGVLAFYSLGGRRDYIPFFTGIDKAKFRTPVVPGDQLQMALEVRRRHGDRMWAFIGRASVDGKLAAEAELQAMMTVKPA
ncbi:MAG TPA: 3-hydroxyacyl-ACP dehydratase FabZ [Candidatus Tectomicrobia bacterium]|nr:3-hydroxyacyl-ACP dehydratase FabZ [Candidatus Tectomicrobia bacterium]